MFSFTFQWETERPHKIEAEMNYDEDGPHDVVLSLVRGKRTRQLSEKMTDKILEDKYFYELVADAVQAQGEYYAEQAYDLKHDR
jgi:hypothetical protein